MVSPIWKIIADHDLLKLRIFLVISAMRFASERMMDNFFLTKGSISGYEIRRVHIPHDGGERIVDLVIDRGRHLPENTKLFHIYYLLVLFVYFLLGLKKGGVLLDEFGFVAGFFN